ncbi:hypothetical protein Q669_29490 [Labrenzia sp. C1B10]|uniref:hypothetical protein n=1 Tax=unclassified Labrenzia TaxID=2648686 RepID=UPI0003B87893|nr:MULTISPECIES: hypothetical protein [unclassified Labrenzia]ERP95704.1 hypothetical protein Q669_29490 [Labrenzia sp. C1B10]ERS05770.1 hypothetical protein Q675_29055 [Labrenzia sp. C1B70]
MALSITKAMAIAACDFLNAYLDAGAANGTLTVFNGTRPADLETAISGQTPLVTFDFADPAFQAAVDASGGGHATANAITSVTAANTGEATFFRAFDSDGNPVMDGSVSNTGGSGDLKLSSTSIVSGIDVTVVSLTITMPASA